MRTIPVILPRRSCRRKPVVREGCVRFKVSVCAGTGMLVGLSAEVFWIDWGDGKSDSDLIHTYETAGVYEVVISAIALNQLNLSRCWLKSVDLSDCPWLEHLDVSFNFLAKLDVSACPYLSVLSCSRNLLQELELGERLPELIWLDCSHNLLYELKLPRVCGLQYLMAHTNQLQGVNCRNCLDLCCVDVAGNEMRPRALEETLDSLPTLEPGVHAWVMFEQNPLFWQVDEERVRKKGWRCGESEER